MQISQVHNRIVAEHSKRNSSVECFRILSMFLVLIVHLNGIFAGLKPHEFNFYNQGQVIIEAISVICVNCFLIISGFYGIRFKWKSVWDFYILIVSIRLPFFIVRSIYNHQFDLSEFIFSITPLTSENYFINGYFLLMIFAPVLNSFIEQRGKSVWKFAVLLYGLEFIYDCVQSNSVIGFSEGYSVLHFIIVYFLARSAYLNKEKLEQISGGYFLLLWFAATLINIVLINLHIEWSLSYTNPLVLFSAFCLFFFFVKREFHNPYINWIAKSAFAVYLVHLTSPIATPFINLDRYCLNNFSYGYYLLAMLGMALAMYCFSVVYDKCRIALTERLTDKIYLIFKNIVRKQG